MIADTAGEQALTGQSMGEAPRREPNEAALKL